MTPDLRVPEPVRNRLRPRREHNVALARVRYLSLPLFSHFISLNRIRANAMMVEFFEAYALSRLRRDDAVETGMAKRDVTGRTFGARRGSNHRMVRLRWLLVSALLSGCRSPAST